MRKNINFRQTRSERAGNRTNVIFSHVRRLQPFLKNAKNIIRQLRFKQLKILIPKS